MDQLTRIFDIVGTPTEREWPERAAVTCNNFRQSPARNWSDVVPEMDVQARDLVEVSKIRPCLISIYMFLATVLQCFATVCRI